MNIFYIARHGETENNQARRLSGWIDTPLTPRGLEPTQLAIAKLRDKHITHIYSSDLGRAFVTAYEIGRGLSFSDEIIRLSGLREVNYGAAANMPTSEAYAQYPRLDRDTHYTPPEGESLEHMQQRILQTLNALNDTHTDNHILIVAHSGAMAALKASFIGQDFGEHNISEAYAHDYIARFTIQDGTVTAFDEVTA